MIRSGPAVGGDAILPSLSISTADGVRFVPKSTPTSSSGSYRNCDLNLARSILISSSSPEGTNSSRGAPFGGSPSHLFMSSDIPLQNGHDGFQKSNSVSRPRRFSVLIVLPS